MITELTSGTIALEAAEMTGVSLVTDPRFSQVLQLEANSELKLLEVAHLQGTCDVWIKRQSATAQIDLSILGGWSIRTEGGLLLNDVATGQVIPLDQWYNLCFTFKNGQLSLHINGEFCAETEIDSAELTGNLTYRSTSGHILLANPKFSELALSESAIQSNYIGELPTISQGFTQVQPINFDLVNHSDGPFGGYPDNKLFIVDAIGKETIPIQLIVQNVNTTTIELEAHDLTTASIEHHHFELRLRNGVLAQIKDTLQFETQSDWIISEPLQDPLDHTWSVFFLAKSAKTWATDETWIFPFEYRTADGALGERGTHVSLSYRQMTLNSGGILTGDRTRQVDILNLSSNNQYISQMSEQVSLTDQKIDDMENQAADELKKLKEILREGQQENGVEQAESLGDILSLVNERLNLLDAEVDSSASVTKKRLEDLEAGSPLVASFYAPNGVTCGVSNELIIRLENQLDRTVTFEEGGEVIIKFPIGNDQSNFAATKANCGNIQSASASNKHTAEMAVFKIPGVALGAGETHEYLLKQVVPNSKIGISTISIDVIGVTGYQTLELSLQIQKNSRDLAAFAGGGNVGVGTKNNVPKQKLDVRGSAYLSGSIGLGSSSPVQKLDVRGSTYISGSLGLGNSRPVQKLDVRGSAYVSGNVGLGDSRPSQKLVVVGNIMADRMYDRNNSSYYVNPSSSSKMDAISGRRVQLNNSSRNSNSVNIQHYGNYPAIYINSPNKMALTGHTGNGNAIKGENNSRNYPTFFARNHKRGGSYGSRSGDYAEYFRSQDADIPNAISVVLDEGKVRPAKEGEVPMGIISTSPIIVGNLPDEWSGKCLKDEFGEELMEETTVEKQVPKKKIVKTERQKITINTVTETVIELEIYEVDGQYRQREVEKEVIKEVEELKFEEVNLYNESGTEIIGKHEVPVMEVIEEEVIENDEAGNPMMIGSGEFETQERPVLNPDYDPAIEYMPRSERSHWVCVGLVGQLPLLKGQPVAPNWIKMHELSDKADMWFVK